YIQLQDEFMFRDTFVNRTTAYIATSELWVDSLHGNTPTVFPDNEVFHNVDANLLFDYPLEYNEVFWEHFQKRKPQHSIPLHIENDMSFPHALTYQFKHKHERDTNIQAPVAPKIPYTYSKYGHNLTDPYHWLK